MNCGFTLTLCGLTCPYVLTIAIGNHELKVKSDPNIGFDIATSTEKIVSHRVNDRST